MMFFTFILRPPLLFLISDLRVDVSNTHNKAEAHHGRTPIRPREYSNRFG